MKTLYTQYGIGKSKWSVSFHDGVSKHPDGSPFFAIRLFKGKRKMEAFVDALKSLGYTEE